MLARALNSNQILILSEINGNSSISALLSRLSEHHGIPLSSLKLNSRILRELGLIEISRNAIDYGAVALSNEGRLVMDIIYYE